MELTKDRGLVSCLGGRPDPDRETMEDRGRGTSLVDWAVMPGTPQDRAAPARPGRPPSIGRVPVSLNRGLPGRYNGVCPVSEKWRPRGWRRPAFRRRSPPWPGVAANRITPTTAGGGPTPNLEGL